MNRQKEKRRGKSVGLKIGMLNVGTMTGKGRELVNMMGRRKVDILCVQETRWKGSKYCYSKVLDRDLSCFIMVWIGGEMG